MLKNSIKCNIMYSKEEGINVRISSTKAKLNQKVNICLELAADYGFVNEAIVIVHKQNGVNEQKIKLEYLWTEKEINFFTCNLKFEETGLYYFCIKLIINGEEKFVKYNIDLKRPIITNNDYPYWTITVYDSDFEVPDWAKGKIMYQIFVDRFYKSQKYTAPQISNRVIKKWGEMPKWEVINNPQKDNTDFFMGNLKGIEEKIPYLKDLGVEIIYLSPIFKSQSNHRYDVSDYEEVDPFLGTKSDLSDLCKKAHENGMKIILDGVFNHTGNDSKYFNEYGNYDTLGAFQSKKSKYYKWYKKNKNDEFEYWWGFKNLPVCDGNNSSWQNFIYGKKGIIDRWFETGIDGLRLDVADELTDEFIANIRKAVKRNKKDGFIIGEVWENAITKEKNGIQRKYLLGNGLDSVMNYPFTNAILKYIRFGNFQYFTKTVNEIIDQYPKETVNCLMNSLSTHDITRALTTLIADGIDENTELIWDVNFDRKWQFENDKLTKNQYEKGRKMLKLATIIQYFLPGNACIYYGDEIGMYGYKDPFNRKCFEWENIDEVLYNFYKELGKIKRNNTFLEDANFKIIKITKEILIFERYNENESITVILNRTSNVLSNNKEFLYDEGEILLKENFKDNNISEYGFAIIKNKNTKLHK